MNTKALLLTCAALVVLVGGAVLLMWKPLSDTEKAAKVIATKNAAEASAECEAARQKSLTASSDAFACMNLRGRTPADMQLERCKTNIRDWNMLQELPRACTSPLLGLDVAQPPAAPAGAPPRHSQAALDACKAAFASLATGEPWPPVCGQIANWTAARGGVIGPCTKDTLCY